MNSQRSLRRVIGVRRSCPGRRRGVHGAAAPWGRARQGPHRRGEPTRRPERHQRRGQRHQQPGDGKGRIGEELGRHVDRDREPARCVRHEQRPNVMAGPMVAADQDLVGPPAARQRSELDGEAEDLLELRRQRRRAGEVGAGGDPEMREARGRALETQDFGAPQIGRGVEDDPVDVRDPLPEIMVGDDPVGDPLVARVDAQSGGLYHAEHEQHGEAGADRETGPRTLRRCVPAELQRYGPAGPRRCGPAGPTPRQLRPRDRHRMRARSRRLGRS